jgi:ribonucleotide monophosphatase NagD (HAD superfamily)
MIGDSLNTDILFANNAKIDSMLVFTGVTKEEKYFNLNDTELIAKPTYILKQF